MKLKHIKSAILTLDSGVEIPVTFLGKGRFSEAYANCANAYVITRERSWGTDYSKRIIYNMDSDNIHLPKIELIGLLDGCKSDVFKMPLYNKLTAFNKEAWSYYKELSKIKAEVWYKSQEYIRGNVYKYNAYMVVQDIARQVEDSKILPDSIKEAIQLLEVELVDNGYHSWMFEFERKANLMVDNKGNLILLDVIFDMELLENSRNRRNR